jgi:hypothetical protein
VGNKSDLEEKRKVTFEEAVKLAKRLNLSAVFETSAKSNNSIDDVFFRSIVNCVDFYNVGNDDPLTGKKTVSGGGGARSRKFSAQTEIIKRGNSFKDSSFSYNSNNDDTLERVGED